MSFNITANDDNYDLYGNTGTDGDAGTAITGGTYTFKVDGTFNSASVILKWKSPSDAGGFVAVGSDTTLTADGMANAELARGTCLVAVSGGGGSVDVDVSFIEIDKV